MHSCKFDVNLYQLVRDYIHLLEPLCVLYVFPYAHVRFSRVLFVFMGPHRPHRAPGAGPTDGRVVGRSRGEGAHMLRELLDTDSLLEAIRTPSGKAS
jgi:hypothetical protein